MRNLLPIGRFSQVCRLSIPALRHYDELGLLTPATVDPDTGYRYYSISQAEDADRIRSLRFLEMPLPEIRAVLSATPEQARDILRAHRERLATQIERQRFAIGLLDAMMREEPPMTYEVHLQQVQPQLAASIRGRAAWADLGAFVGGSLQELYQSAGSQGIRFAGPPYAIYHHADSTEAEVDVEVGVPVADPVDPCGRVVNTEIAGGLVATTMHCGAYENVGPAYRALGEWVQEHGHEMAGPPREIYLTDPNAVPDPGANRTEIVWPIK